MALCPLPIFPAVLYQPLLGRAWSCMARAGFTLRSGKSFQSLCLFSKYIQPQVNQSYLQISVTQTAK